MKKHHAIYCLLILSIIGVCLVYLIGGYFQQHIGEKKLWTLLPDTPLVYLQGSHVRTFLKQLEQNPRYQDFLQSPFVKQVQSTVWWQDFILSFEAFWKSIIIDPMRIIGTDLAIGVYEAGQGEILPGILVVSRIDLIARMTERGLYLFELFSGELGIRFEQDLEGEAVYRVDRSDMVVPMYYSIIDNIAMASTSLPLLKKMMHHALQQGVEQDPDPAAGIPSFRDVVHTLPETRVLTLYWHPSAFATFFRNDVAKPLKFDDRHPKAVVDFPLITLYLDLERDRSKVHVEFFHRREAADERKTESPTAFYEEHTGEQFRFQVPDDISRGFPLIVAFHPENTGIFLHILEKLFPKQTRISRFQRVEFPQGAFGELAECRLSMTLFGVLYTVPDMTCVSEALEPERVLIFLTRLIHTILDQVFASAHQRALVTTSQESYQESLISSVRVIFQEVLSYTVTNSQPSYAFITTNRKGLQSQLDSLQAHPDTRPYTMRIATQSEEGPSPYTPVGVVFIQNDLLAEFLHTLSQTTTFSLVFPQHEYLWFYQLLPDVLMFLRSLPPLLFEAGIHARKLSITIQIP